jgi:UDP-glucose 4-epimerase
MGRCLVLGGTGFIGRHVVQALRDRGQEPIVTGFRKRAGDVDLLVDFCDAAQVGQAVAGVDTVIHLAWTSVPKSATDDPVFDVTSNVVGSLNLFKACAQHGVRRVLFCSTGGAIYGAAERLPIQETDPLEPRSSYGVTKLTVEKYLRMFSQHYGFEHVILRPGNAYGEGQNSSRGQGVIAACLDAARTRTDFVVWGDGTVRRDYVHVGDVARAFVLASTAPSSGPVPNKVINIGTGKGHSVDEIVRLVRRITGREIRTRRDVPRVIDSPVNVLDSSLAAAALGWQPQVRLEDGIVGQWRALLESTRRQDEKIAGVRNSSAVRAPAP